MLAAGCNGHSAVWPSCEAISDGAWVTFVRDKKAVFRSNAAYAAANFEVRRPGEEPKDAALQMQPGQVPRKRSAAARSD